MHNITFEFYIKRNKNLGEMCIKWFDLLKIIKPETFSFFHPHKGDKYPFKIDLIIELLKDNLLQYEDYLLEIKGENSQYISISIAPYLKEISKLNCKFTKENYENNKKYILEVINQIISTDEIMLGYGHPAVYNKYFERGYGHIKFGAYWMMCFGKWSLKYLDSERINRIRENTINSEITDRYVKAILSESPWEYSNEIFEKSQRKFMKKLKFADIVAIYNKEREFTEIEFEEEDPLLEEDNSPCPYEE